MSFWQIEKFCHHLLKKTYLYHQRKSLLQRNEWKSNLFFKIDLFLFLMQFKVIYFLNIDPFFVTLRCRNLLEQLRKRKGFLLLLCSDTRLHFKTCFSKELAILFSTCDLICKILAPNEGSLSLDPDGSPFLYKS